MIFTGDSKFIFVAICCAIGLFILFKGLGGGGKGNGNGNGGSSTPKNTGGGTTGGTT